MSLFLGQQPKRDRTLERQQGAIALPQTNSVLNCHNDN